MSERASTSAPVVGDSRRPCAGSPRPSWSRRPSILAGCRGRGSSPHRPAAWRSVAVGDGVATKSTPTDVVTAVRPCAGDPDPGSAGRAAPRRPGGGRGTGRSGASGRGGRGRRHGHHLGGRPDRRHGELPVRDALVRGVPGGGAGRGLGGRCGDRTGVRTAVECGPRCRRHLRRAAGAGLHGDRARTLDAGHRLLLQRRAEVPAGPDDQRDAAARARCAAGRLGRARPVCGGRRVGGRLRRARLQLVGLGRRRADRGRGRRGASGCPVRPAPTRPRTGWARTPCWRPPPASPSRSPRWPSGTGPPTSDPPDRP